MTLTWCLGRPIPHSEYGVEWSEMRHYVGDERLHDSLVIVENIALQVYVIEFVLFR
jgi:hypothetical protein